MATASRTRLLASSVPVSTTGRWAHTPSSGLQASWPASCLTLRFTGTYLALEGGPNTARLGRPDGEEPMLAWCVTSPGEVESEARVQVGNLRSGQVLTLFHEPNAVEEEHVCKLYIADWGSVVEIGAFFCDAADSLRPTPAEAEPAERFLVIGDSISCAYSMGKQWGLDVPAHGAWDGYPLLFGRLLAGEGKNVGVETVAYPGITLVDQYSHGWQEDGMVSKFWQKSWFSREPWGPERTPLYNSPTTVIIALGANDDGSGVPVFHFTSSVRAFVERLATAFAGSLTDIVILTPFYSMGAGRSRFAAATPALVEDLRHEWEEKGGMPRVHSVSTQGWLTQDLAPDGIHPSVEGNKVMAGKLREAEKSGWKDHGTAA
ncbi:hypothetical protein CALVIDRAFT_408406 [Calocera viscosa TUFC12733]|uniref:SGNH hydrolase-type esterase domain-containing protein n=1 Tax=Calocera viscosa (strain TUFC12733) TaxID=1330018 RepID=A0A167G968_CALVF|nr:hypothetical protein CALVIDRAFT_408406 [Calocera viscosa TUFC12733]